MTLFNFSAAFPLAVFVTTFWGTAVWAQASCSSDGQRPPTALIERFISADCDTCWTAPALPRIKPHELAIDWIVPSAKGDDAPLSAAATVDAQFRLQALRQPVAQESVTLRHAVSANPPPLRVARGVVLGGYMGASIALTPRRGTPLPQQPLTAWLVMIEDVPAGTDGTRIARQLVRNSLQINWNEPNAKRTASPTSPSPAFYESRPMSIPAGANPDRLSVAGWVQDVNGKVIASAVSVCIR